MTKNYYRLMLGRKSIYSKEAYEGGFVGADYGIDTDLSNELTDDWREFNQKFIPTWLEQNPGKSKVAAGLSCGFLYKISKGMLRGDVVLSPDGAGNYYAGEVVGDYYYQEGSILPHRRDIRWFDGVIPRESMSQPLKNSTGSIGSVSTITQYAEELESLISGKNRQQISSLNEEIESATEFALEKHLEDFLVKNWQYTELAKSYDIFTEDGEIIGQQYPSDTGPLDILAISKDKNTLLVIELKRGRVADSVVGQVQRYMGYIKAEVAEPNQEVKGLIIALEDDIRIKRALSVTTNIDFYTYSINFRLNRVE